MKSRTVKDYITGCYFDKLGRTLLWACICICLLFGYSSLSSLDSYISSQLRVSQSYYFSPYPISSLYKKFPLCLPHLVRKHFQSTVRHGSNSCCLYSCNNHWCRREFWQQYPQENE